LVLWPAPTKMLGETPWHKRRVLLTSHAGGGTNCGGAEMFSENPPLAGCSALGAVAPGDCFRVLAPARSAPA
jgi:hypothetical protein